MTDFAGGLLDSRPRSRPFPDPDVSTPKSPFAAIAPPVGSPFPSNPRDPRNSQSVPTMVPFERVDTFDIRALGVNQGDATNRGPAQNAGLVGGVVVNLNGPVGGPESAHAGGIQQGLDADWFDKWLVQPGRLDLGNVLSTQIRQLELLNNFRTEFRTWEAFVNNAGAGVSVTNLPGLPLVFAPLSSFVVNVQVDTAGPPTILGTFDFDIDQVPPDILVVPITGNRITMFRYRPQSPISETLEFKTDIIEHNDGGEQRISVREAPRQKFQFTVRTDDDRTRDSINALLFDWQARVFGIPVWHESKALDAPLGIGNTTVQVDTAFADFRVGGLVMIYDDNFINEALEIAVINPTDIELSVGVSRAYDAVNTIVMPVRTGFTRPNLSQARYAIGPTDFKLEFTTIDNVDLSDASAFGTYQGAGQTVAKPSIDRLNFMKGRTLPEGIRRKITRLDNQTGQPAQISSWSKGKPSITYGFENKSFQDTWEYRQLMHFLRGSQLAFYLGTGRADIKPVVDMADTSTQIDFENFGFTQFVQEVTPRSDLQIHRVDGTVSQHEITGSVVVSDDVERLTVNPGISPALPVADVDRIEFLSLNRVANDRAVFSHRRPGESRLDLSLLGVPS